jgi:hypothetical protein
MLWLLILGLLLRLGAATVIARGRYVVSVIGGYGGDGYGAQYGG